MEPSLSTELAIRAFDADAALSAALAEFQKGPHEDSIIADVRRASEHGLAWFSRPSEPGFFEVVLRHKAGAEISADGESITATLAGLLGHPLAHDAAFLPTAEPLAVDAQASEPDNICNSRITAAPAPQLAAVPAPSPAQAAAESLAAATGGAVVAEVVADPGPDATQLLTDEQKKVCIEMVNALSAGQQKAFKISFRDAFRVPREARAIAPLITEVRHMEFCDRWSIEATGGVAP
jgi:hypothetical protein